MTKEERDDLPFGVVHDSEGGCFAKVGWYVDSRNSVGVSQSLSFGKVFGYCDEENANKELADYVWQKLCDHFHNRPFDEWDKVNVNQEDFLLEIDLEIKIKEYEKRKTMGQEI